MEYLREKGYTILDDIFSPKEVALIIDQISLIDSSKPNFRRTSDLFAIRQFLKEVPKIQSLIFTTKLNAVIKEYFGPNYFTIKSIYFDKPEKSNWFVAWHQDLTISVDKKINLPGFGPWTVKQDQFAVQPPLDILEDIFTIRIHLDDTDENNGALKVIPGSHLGGIQRPTALRRKPEEEAICKVKTGGIMIMRPLLLHSSSRTINNHKRRVIHIEFCSRLLPGGLNWSEGF